MSAGATAARVPIAAIVVLLMASGSAVAGSAATPTPLSARTSLSPATAAFGDPVVAEVKVQYDADVVSPRDIRVTPSFGPFETKARSVAQPNGTTVVYRYMLQCVSDGCVPSDAVRTVRFAPVVVSAGSDAGRLTTTARWQPLAVKSRLTERDRAGRLVFREQRPLPAPSYAISPGLLAYGLIGIAAIAAILGVAAIVRELRLRSSRSTALTWNPVERGLAYVRDAAGRPADSDRRRALELLAQAVADTGDTVAASHLRKGAWVEAPPTPARSLELAEDVEAARTTS